MKSEEFNYRDLQDHIEVMIGKFGLQNSVKFLGSLIDHTEATSSEDERAKKIIELTISKSIEVFNLKKAKFYSSDLGEYREARMSCYYIVSKYTDISFGKIAEVFKVKRRSVTYFHEKCKETLSIADFYPTYAQRHTILENHIIKYISTLNS